MDIIFINPKIENNYQELTLKYAAIEPPTWALLLAQSMRRFGYKSAIIDANAERLDDQIIYERIHKLNPKLICFVVYGQNVNAGTTNMEGDTIISKYLKLKNKNLLIAFVGSHVQALPI